MRRDNRRQIAPSPPPARYQIIFQQIGQVSAFRRLGMDDTFSTEIRGNLQRLKPSRTQIIGILVTSLLAVLAAFLKIAIRLQSHTGWDWVGFFQDVVQFAFIAAIVAFASSAIIKWDVERYHGALVNRTLQTILISFYGQTKSDIKISLSDARVFIVGKRDSLATIRDGLENFTVRAEEDLTGADPDILRSIADAQRDVWVRLSKGITEFYAQDGLRHQRTMLFSYIVAELGQISSTSGASLAERAIIARDRAIQYLARITMTDVAIESDFALRNSSTLSVGTQKDAPIFSAYPVDLRALSCTSDRVVYLMAYCDTVMANATQREQINDLVVNLKLSLSALSKEVDGASRLAEALVDLTDEAIAQKRSTVAAQKPHVRSLPRRTTP
jgi:hypothetical protein